MVKAQPKLVFDILFSSHGDIWTGPLALSFAGGRTHTELKACDLMPNLLTTRLLRTSTELCVISIKVETNIGDISQ